MRFVERQITLKWGPHVRCTYRERDKRNGALDTSFCPVDRLSRTVMNSSVSVNVINGYVFL
jgi:hypothetical protein